VWIETLDNPEYIINMDEEKELDDTLAKVGRGLLIYKSLYSPESMKRLVSLSPIVCSIKFFVSMCLYLGVDVMFQMKCAIPVMGIASKLASVKTLKWINRHTHRSLSKIWETLWIAYSAVTCWVSIRLTHYWVWWFVQYLVKDNSFQETMDKIYRNPLVPLDMADFYRILIYGNDNRYEFVKENIIHFKLIDMYRDRQIRNGLVPQF
jgi:hypothetical protein